MGVPKQKWTQEEEASLKAGVIKHGPGKWSTILKDPEFGSVLWSRSNVDLKVQNEFYICTYVHPVLYKFNHMFTVSQYIDDFVLSGAG